ncbi:MULTISPECIES: DUF5331 domain-containing protein [Cyanophyceae]|uniref:DUF5331 domain-containing protein n=1 Tax=Nodularia spumigena CENA596 TaxID=1819295 RepID=A0A166KWM2_NODSP|nr:MULTISPECIES: DUF5331 domain-containing protein [Cyanophyceae]KZL51632.1 hypothetical protein A2T98_01215 [Nodularia spumigena CENA596]MDB9305234.1 DUF5331 domain-containing protein [Nodularia spumigena CS-591/12]MDB9323629.1 DUF5331 domain-containing protein [Nodularia spumigena CS-591/07A]MDB9330186.1 DUF5331 domain-containing protein [Nodularia spumigena CS-591/04]MDB9339943.1 DUF5331 domain-containing protein [Nodularia spumigena CS-589/07]
MAFFSSFTDSIRQKWLQFFQANREWITLHMKAESVYTPDGGKRPPSYLILGVVNALEPKLAQLMMPFSRLNADADTLIEVLDLHFDPDIALGNRFIPPAATEAAEDAEEINQYESAETVDENTEDETLAMSYTNGFEMDSDLQNLVVGESESSESELGDEFKETLSMDADDFGEISFDAPTPSEEKLDDQMLEELNTPDENAFKDVLSDVWGNETASENSEENNDLLGEELSSGVFDESEIARLFPNA